LNVDVFKIYFAKITLPSISAAVMPADLPGLALSKYAATATAFSCYTLAPWSTQHSSGQELPHVIPLRLNYKDPSAFQFPAMICCLERRTK
jgi:hypothetical protein